MDLASAITPETEPCYEEIKRAQKEEKKKEEEEKKKEEEFEVLVMKDYAQHLEAGRALEKTPDSVFTILSAPEEEKEEEEEHEDSKDKDYRPDE